MTPPHLYAGDVGTPTITIAGEDARHAVRVLRLRPGERVTISDGAGTVVDAVVSSAGRELVADVVERRSVARGTPELTVVQAIPKGHKLDAIVQDLTEVGVDRIVPLRARRSVARWDDPAAKLARLRSVAREAGKQSRRAWLPVVGDPVTVDDAPLGEVSIVLHEDADRGLAGALPSVAPASVVLFVGPEGGFAEDEIDALMTRSVVPVTLGPQILRTETASVIGAALIYGTFGRLG